MLKELFTERGVSTYQVSKATGIPYSTLSDLIIEKTDIRKSSAETVYRLAKYFDLMMENFMEDTSISQIFHLYNDGRNVMLHIGPQTLQYMGPKNLIAFHHINRLENHILYLDTYFQGENDTIYSEEDFIDLKDLFEEFGITERLSSPYQIKLGRPGISRKQELLNEALLVSDNLAIVYVANNGYSDICVDVINMSRTTSKMTIRLKDYSILLTNMSDKMQKRALEAVKRNIVLINEEIRERQKYA